MQESGQAERMFVPLALVQLPPFPTVAVKVLKLASNTDSSLQQLGDTIATDPVFGSEILKIVNSPLYGLPNSICNIMGAVALLGTEYVKGLAVTIGVRAYLGCALGNPAVRAIWRHSLATGLLAEELGRVNYLEQGIAYTAGIMHDIGRVALAVLAPREYADFLREAHGSQSDCRLLERQFFAEDHCQIGLRMARAWGLPPELVRVVAYHHEMPSGDPSGVPAIAGLGCRIADAIGYPAVPGLITSGYRELLQQMTARQRERMETDAEVMTFRIGAKINSIESI